MLATLAVQAYHNVTNHKEYYKRLTGSYKTSERMPMTKSAVLSPAGFIVTTSDLTHYE